MIRSLFVFLTLAFSHLIADVRSRSDLQKISKNQQAISYTFSIGRLGDNLLSYLHARWLSYKYNMPFLYAPFPYSDQFILHEHDVLHLENCKHFFTRKWILQNEAEIPTLPHSLLIYVPYFPESEIEFKMHPGLWPFSFKIDWHDPEFNQMIRKLIAPRLAITTLEMPNQPWITVAVHVRKGGNFDPACLKFDLPLKFPPDNFYIAAIRKMSELFSHQEMYVYLFTDDLDPPQIVSKYQEALKDLAHIHFDCRKTNNGPGVNVLEDFFSIQKFDCLIRPESNYTIVAEKLKDFKTVISPVSYHIDNGIVYIDDIIVKTLFH